MPRSDTWRSTGYENDITTALLMQGGPGGRVNTGTTPVEFPSGTTGIDLRTLGRGRILCVLIHDRVSNGATATFTESATTNGTYTAAVTGTNPAKVTADGVQVVTIKRNRAKPFLRVVLTGDNAAADSYVAIALVGGV